MTVILEHRSVSADDRTRPPIRCRAITEADLDAVVSLLTRGFPERSSEYWRRGLERMAARAVPDGCPRFGYVLAAGERLVGVLLTIYADSRAPGGRDAWCNLSSWYVEPDVRPYATLLDRIAMSRRQTTYTNISAAPHTIPGHELRGFRRLSAGLVLALPIFAPLRSGATIRAVGPGETVAGVPPNDALLLRDHADWGCIALLGEDRDGCEPFVFVPRPVDRFRRRLGFSPGTYAQTLYFRSPEALQRFAAPIGRHLLARHRLAVLSVDADGPIPGVAGRFFKGRGVRLVRGSESVRAGDLAYSEWAFFGP